jgi:HNH endonuclease
MGRYTDLHNHLFGKSNPIMTNITLLWHDIEAAGYTDVLPAGWFAARGHYRGRKHDVRGPRGGKYRAECDVVVRRTSADLDYRRYKKLNRSQGMLLGVLRLQFQNSTRKAVTQVFWQGEAKNGFEPSSTTISTKPGPGPSAVPDIDLIGIEGRQYLAAHLHRERRPKLMKAKKAAVLKATGTLACEVCGFDFASMYGPLGDGYCEVHHRVGLGDGGEKKVSLRDLATLCSNCHRMIHRTGKPMLSVEEFSSAVRTWNMRPAAARYARRA